MPFKASDAPIDLHAHTTASDGSDAPEHLVRLAAEYGLAAIAVTDHDTIEGVGAAQRAAGRFSVEVIPGVEISAKPPQAVREAHGVLHILGYLIDPESEHLAAALAWMQERRAARNPEIIRRLNALGINLTLADVARHADAGQIGRPHIAQALVGKGVVASVQEAFDRYLRTGGPAAVEKEKLGPAQAIGAIHAAGGVAVLAHPYQLNVGDALESALRDLVEAGLDGIECRYSQHTSAQVRRYRGFARTYGLVQTGGSDYHGATKPNVPLGLHPPVRYRVIDMLRQRRDAKSPSDYQPLSF